MARRGRPPVVDRIEVLERMQASTGRTLARFFSLKLASSLTLRYDPPLEVFLFWPSFNPVFLARLNQSSRRSFNVADLSPFHGEVPPPIPLPIMSTRTPMVTDRVREVLDVDYVTTRNRQYSQYKVAWKDRPDTDTSWITDAQFKAIDPDYYQAYCDWISRTSSSNQGELMRITFRLRVRTRADPPDPAHP